MPHFKVGDKTSIKIKGTSGFEVGTPVEILKVITVQPWTNIHNYQYLVKRLDNIKGRDIEAYTKDDYLEISKTNMNTTSPCSNQAATLAVMKEVVELTARQLFVPNNTATTLEIKNLVRVTEPYFNWTQKTISDLMNEICSEEGWIYTDNGTFRTYSDPALINMTKTPVKKKVPATVGGTKAITPSRISRTKALAMIQGNRGHFFTATFIAKKGERTINCQYMKPLAGQQDATLGYIKVREAIKLKTTPDDCIRQINLQTLKNIKIEGNFYKISG